LDLTFSINDLVDRFERNSPATFSIFATRLELRAVLRDPLSRLHITFDL
jgi:hypothetical protein